MVRNPKGTVGIRRLVSLTLMMVALSGLSLLFTNCQKAPQTQGSPSSETSGALPSPTPVSTTTPCPAPASVGFKIVEYSPGLKAAVWYPTNDSSPSGVLYPGGLSGDAVRDANPMSCGAFPLIVFSHGYLGCGTQIVFLTQELARKGYIVAAPDHLDALCSVDGGPSRGPYPRNPNPSNTAYNPDFNDPQLWSDATHVDRRNDIQTLMTHLVSSSFRPSMNVDKMAIMGHSMGGYTSLGMLGAWPSWKDARLKAGLLLSPYLQPYLIPYPAGNPIGQIALPLMYQGGTLDSGLTPFIEGPRAPYTIGAYDASVPSKYFLEIIGAAHFAWTDSTCNTAGATTVSQCLALSTTARLILDYSVAFFEKNLKAYDQPLLRTPSAGLRTYRFEESP